MKKLDKYINPRLPEYEEYEDNPQMPHYGETTEHFRRQNVSKYPQYEDFLKNVTSAVEEDRIPELKKNITESYESNGRYGVRNEPTSVESLLSSLGVGKDYLEKLHYKTANPEPVERKAINNKMAELYLDTKNPEALQNMKYAESLVDPDYPEDIEKPLADENLKYLKRMAQEVVDPKSKPKSYKPLSPHSPAFAEYDLDKQEIRYSPITLTTKSMNSIPHELMHHKENISGNDTSFGSENLDIDFRKGNKVDADKASNRSHITLPLEISEEVDKSKLPVGERPVFFNALKKLMNEKK